MSSINTPPASGKQPPATPAPPPAGSWATVEPPARDRSPFESTYTRTTYRPTAEQLARDEQRHQYLRRNVYLPIIIAVIIVVLLFGLVIALAFGIGTPQVASFIAGLAALIVILFSIPLIILMTIMPITWLALRLNRRQRRKEFPETGPMAYRSRFQILLWQLDGLLGRAQPQVEGVARRLRRPLINLHARFAYLRGFLRGILGKFTRSS